MSFNQLLFATPWIEGVKNQPLKKKEKRDRYLLGTSLASDDADQDAVLTYHPAMLMLP